MEELVVLVALLTDARLRAQTDSRLIDLVAGGNDRAFIVIVQRHTPALRRYCTRLVGPAGAEDCVQQAFLKVWSALSRGEEICDLTAWLHCVARNAAFDVLRKSHGRCEALHDKPAADDVAVEVLHRTLARQTLVAVRSLPPRQRQALLHTAVDGQSGREAADELGLTECALRQLVRRARVAVRATAA